MKDEDKQLLGKCLLAVGGTVLIGSIIGSWLEEEGSSREILKDSKTKVPKQKTTWKSSLFANDLKSKEILNQAEKPIQPNRFLVEVPKVDRFKKAPESILQLQTEERKYPNHYYSLSKAQQYKFRKKLANQLFQISQERK